jgi:hypothetical protein
VGGWPTADHRFWPVLPEIDGPLYRMYGFATYGNPMYFQAYPNSVGGPWRLDLADDDSVLAFGEPADFADIDDAKSKPTDATPYNGAGIFHFTDYGLLSVTRAKLNRAFIGSNDNALLGEVEANYDAIAHMLLSPAKYAEILDNIGGPSLAPAYMAIAIPGEDGQVLGAAEYGYQLARNDTNTPRPGEIDKTYLHLDSSDPTLELPVAAKIGPYAQQWVDLAGDEWLYIGGYIGLTRLQYSYAGVPRQRFTVDKFDTRLATVQLDAAGGGAIKRYRYLHHGLDDRIFLTGTHTAERGGTAYSGGLLSFHPGELDTLSRLSYMSRGYNTTRMRSRVVRESDGTPVQEFILSGGYNSDYEHTITADEIPANTDSKFFLFEYSAGQMRDRMGVSLPT